MDWLLTVPLLLVELIMVMSLDDETTVTKSAKLGFAAALMVILGCVHLQPAFHTVHVRLFHIVRVRQTNTVMTTTMQIPR